ncbi:pyridoxamine 5'-phosphate oxidase family protein [Candidatus Phyllobacterium onerii]|uniref:pyridoxamine 5'-phosphate oxidase family protein n=1 Tax=Candidatus Phyllobacterium onerii TaxID=3020828 RepID=UPI00233045F5|nr:pyridoxamine 5'-phosphate oxidase family protein [Phyllobacterium sp. IY22]
MGSTIDNRETSPWHAGELALQKSAAAVEKMDDIGRRVVRNTLIEQHRLFYPQLPFVIAGAVDRNGNAWATIFTGRPGFMQATDAVTLSVAGRRDPTDPADDGMENGDAIGLLGIELHTQRRNRLNGRIRRSSSSDFDLSVIQSYGNCPRYIQIRDVSFAGDRDARYHGTVETSSGLDEEARSIIASSDTFFVASYVGDGWDRQVDVSHRGGRPGFVRVGNDDVLTIPDFNGNLFFNTLGNILVNGRAGLLFVDFVAGDLLQLSGTADIVLDSPEIETFQGAERLWHFHADKCVRRKNALPIRGTKREGGESRFSSMTGDWIEVNDRVEALKRTDSE